jgi:hypothetical protein
MPYDAKLTDNERSWSARLAGFWRGIGRASNVAGYATGHPIVGHGADSLANGIASSEQKKADTGVERRLTPEEQDRVNQFYDAHPGSW